MHNSKAVPCNTSLACFFVSKRSNYDVEIYLFRQLCMTPQPNFDPNDINRIWHIVDRRYFLIHFRTLNDRSVCATVTGNVQLIRSATQQFGNKPIKDVCMLIH